MFQSRKQSKDSKAMQPFRKEAEAGTLSDQQCRDQCSQLGSYQHLTIVG